jgi:signal transduction histidine kinase
MTTIRSRLVLLVATAAIAPLIAYGFVSMRLLRSGTERSVTSEAQLVAERAGEQIDGYVRHNLDLLKALASDLQHTSLDRWQQERLLRNYVIQFPEFAELTLFDRTGVATVSSRMIAPTLTLSETPPEAGTGPLLADIEIDGDLLPKTVVTLRIEQAGGPPSFLVGSLRLEELWRLVDRIHIGREGFTLLVDRNGRLLAHGNPDEKPRVARGEYLTSHPLIRSIGDGLATPRWARYQRADGRSVLGVMQPIDSLGWRVILEQPTTEAFALAVRLERFLVLTIGLALLATLGIASLWGRSFLRPIGALTRGTRALAAGRFEERVTIDGRDEFAQLGDAFNLMADHLVTLQAEAVKQERQATFGRIAAGLVHDIAHPVQNIGNNCKLMLKMYDDPDIREQFRKTVDREFLTLKRLLEDLRNLGRPIPLERFPVDVNRSLTEAAEKVALLAEKAGIELLAELGDDRLYIEGDLFALGRVYRNLLLNAVQATPPGGRITIRSRDDGGQTMIDVEDTGCGIAPDRLAQIFDDYTTTKRKGLGLGLAISRRIVEQLGGTIAVESAVGRGTRFTLAFPSLAADRIPPLSPEGAAARARAEATGEPAESSRIASEPPSEDRRREERRGGDRRVEDRRDSDRRATV